MRRVIFPLMLGLVIAGVFVAPDLYVDHQTGNALNPIRDFQPNTAHYLTVLNAARNSGAPVPNSYLHEQQNIPSHYELLQLIAAHVPFFPNLPIALVGTLLRTLVALAYFVLLRLMLKDVGSRDLAANLLSFSVVCLFGFISFQGAALWNWYLPFMLLGIYLGARALKFEISIKNRFFLLSAALVLFSWHAVSFSLGGLAIFLLWLYLIFSSGRELRAKLVSAATLWLILAASIFAILYFPFLLNYGQTALSTIGRVIQFRPTHLLYHPVETLVVLVAAYTLWRAREYGYAVFGLAAIVGLNSNLITGFYFANDHYVILTEALAVAAAVALWCSIDKKNCQPPVWLSLLALLGGLLHLYSGLGYLGFHIAFVGRYLPVTGALFVIAAITFSKESQRDFWRRYWRPALIALTVVSFVYVTILAYKSVPDQWQKQQAAQKILPVIAYLRQHAYAVVLADSKISNYIALYTQDRVYWSNMIFTDVIGDQEILDRWLVSRVFFPNDTLANGDLAVDSVYGAEIRCRHYRQFSKPLLGPLANTFLGRLREADCPRVDAERETQKQSLEQISRAFTKGIRERKFAFNYRLDLLVVSDLDGTPANLLQRDWDLVARAGDFLIYQPGK